MRMGLGLVGLLVVAAIIAVVSSKNAGTASKANKDVRREVAQVTGRGADGVSMEKSAEFAAVPGGLSVTSVVAGGYYDEFYALKKDDVIVEAGSSGSLRGVDDNAATTFLITAAQSKQPLKILRGGQPLTLNPITPK
jgi:hypothetical protein